MGEGLSCSDPQFVGLCQHHLEHRHEGRRLAEVAAAHYVCVDVEALHVGSRLDALYHVVQAPYDGWGELEGNRERKCEKEKSRGMCGVSATLTEFLNCSNSRSALVACRRGPQGVCWRHPASSWFAVGREKYDETRISTALS